MISCDTKLFEVIFKGNDALSDYLHVEVPDQWTEFGEAPLRYGYEKIRNTSADSGWWTYLILHRRDQKLIGTCGYKGKPDASGNVEIGYEILENYRNRGLATEAAMGLIKHAFSHEAVNLVTAHTLAEENASVSVLRKCGFRFAGEKLDPEDGPVWQWTKHKPTADS